MDCFIVSFYKLKTHSSQSYLNHNSYCYIIMCYYEQVMEGSQSQKYLTTKVLPYQVFQCYTSYYRSYYDQSSNHLVAFNYLRLLFSSKLNQLYCWPMGALCVFLKRPLYLDYLLDQNYELQQFNCYSQSLSLKHYSIRPLLKYCCYFLGTPFTLSKESLEHPHH